MYSCTHLDFVLGGPASVLEWAEVSGVTELGHLIIPVSHECGRAHHYMYSVYIWSAKVDKNIDNRWAKIVTR